MRIFPALTVEVFVSALIIGPLLTNVRWRDYFSSGVFFSYFLNVTGNIHYYLPGVFGGNPTADLVNVQLWTIPLELYCYLIITILAVLGIARTLSWLFILTFVSVLIVTSLPQFGLIPLPSYGPLKLLLILLLPLRRIAILHAAPDCF